MTNIIGIKANDPCLQDTPVPPRPRPEGNKIVTLNKQGFMRLETDPFSQAWIDDAIAQSPLPFLEIGCAYGLSSMTALNKGATVIANDISLEHLLILRNSINPKNYDRLYLNTKTFPEELELMPDSIGGALFCRVGHFFTEERLTSGLQKILSWLVPGGKLYFVAVSAYHYTLREEFLPQFLQKKSMGKKYPGYINNMRRYMPRSAENVPEFMHAFDIDTITALITTTEFEVKEAELFDYRARNSNGKGFVGVIAQKP